MMEADVTAACSLQNTGMTADFSDISLTPPVAKKTASSEIITNLEDVSKKVAAYWRPYMAVNL